VSDDYLWDGAGEPDPEVERLERLLRPLRHGQAALRLPPAPAPARRAPTWTWAAAAAVLIALASARLGPSVSGLAWEVERLEGAPQVAGRGVADRGRLAPGQWLETNDTSRVRITTDAVGEVEIEPHSRLRLLDGGSASARMALARGVLHARIWAPPGRFVVDTPSATAVDLGCAYTLEVDDVGAGRVTVVSGWVGFRFENRESFVPRGATCRTRPRSGPGTPYYLDASEPLQEALTRLDFGPEAERAAALDVVLGEARGRDALSLWHLLNRGRATDRERVYARLDALAPAPAGVTRDGVLRGDQHMLDLWWDSLGLDSASWWRRWERPWSPAPGASPAR